MKPLAQRTRLGEIRVLWLAVLAALATGCATATSKPEPATDTTEAEFIYDALHWLRNSAERRAIFEQTYALATRRLEALAEGREPGTWAVSADADETLVDNSPYEVEITRRGESFSTESWNEWVDRRAAPALPGAVAFTRRVQELGGIVAVVTNRDASHCAPTAENLEAVGIAFDIVLCRVDDREKEPRWDALASGIAGQWPEAQLAEGSAPGPVDLLMWLGDNIGDFPHKDQEIRHLGVALPEFGDRYFVLPNPIYGSWEENPRQ